MSFGGQYNLNQRVTYLESIIQTIAPFLPFNLANVLTLGNTADNSIILDNGLQTSTSSIGGMLFQNNSPNPNSYIIDIDNAYGLGVPTISFQDNLSLVSSYVDTAGLTITNSNTGVVTSYKNGSVDYQDATTFLIRNPNDPNFQGQIALTSDSSNPGGSSIVMAAENYNFGGSAYAFGGNQFNCSAGFNLNSSNVAINLDSGTSTSTIGDVNGAGNGTKIVVEDNSYRVNTNAIMMTAYNNSFILPICYTYKMSNTFSYIGVNNSWQNVYQVTINGLPTEFFNTNNTFWDYKIEFSINLRDLTHPTDKGLALYFELVDNGSNTYTPFLYNQPTPWTRHSNSSTYSATSSNMLTFTWTDTISFNSNIVNPLTFSLWWYGDQNNAPNFDAVLSLTRTNIVV